LQRLQRRIDRKRQRAARMRGHAIPTDLELMDRTLSEKELDANYRKVPRYRRPRCLGSCPLSPFFLFDWLILILILGIVAVAVAAGGHGITMRLERMTILPEPVETLATTTRYPLTFWKTRALTNLMSTAIDPHIHTHHHHELDPSLSPNTPFGERRRSKRKISWA
jgi:hypothetical protein